jgi:hypothetical protein
VLAVRRQRLGEEERYREDPALTDIAATFHDRDGHAVGPCMGHPDDDGDDEDEQGIFSLLGHPRGSVQRTPPLLSTKRPFEVVSACPFCCSVEICRSALPMLLFATRVWGRFPLRNYKSLP